MSLVRYLTCTLPEIICRPQQISKFSGALRCTRQSLGVLSKRRYCTGGTNFFFFFWYPTFPMHILTHALFPPLQRKPVIQAVARSMADLAQLRSQLTICRLCSSGSL